MRGSNFIDSQAKVWYFENSSIARGGYTGRFDCTILDTCKYVFLHVHPLNINVP